MRKLRLMIKAIADQQLRQQQESCDTKHEVELLHQPSGGERESQEREAQEEGQDRKVIGQLTNQVEEESGREWSAVSDVQQGNEELQGEAAGLPKGENQFPHSVKKRKVPVCLICIITVLVIIIEVRGFSLIGALLSALLKHGIHFPVSMKNAGSYCLRYVKTDWYC
jgi:hypothetical protein